MENTRGDLCQRKKKNETKINKNKNHNANGLFLVLVTIFEWCEREIDIIVWLITWWNMW